MEKRGNDLNKLKIAVALIIYLVVLMPISFAQQIQEPKKEIDFYTISGTSIIPSKGFDRRTVLDIAYPVYLQPRIRQKQANPKITIASKTAQCTGEDVSEIYMINENTNNPYIVVKSSPAIADREKPVKVNCTMQLQVKQGKEIIGTELENFTVQIPVYNNPLGTISESAQGQIDSINNKINDLKKREDRWQKVNDVFAGIVTVAQWLAEIDKFANYLGAAVWALSSVLYYIPYTKSLGSWAWKVLGCGLINDNMHKMILRYIWNPGIVGGEIFSARADVAVGRIFVTLIKTISVVYSCQLCDYGSSLYAGVQKNVYGDLNMNIEGAKGKPTMLEAFTTYRWDPYRSIHVSMSCLCLPGLVYNMQKETQVNCIYRNCIKQSAELGLPFDSCQQIYKEQNCLYVDGAAWRVAGGTYVAPLLSGLLTSLFEKLPLILIAKEWSSLCDPDCGCFNEGEKMGPKTKSCGSLLQGSESCQKSKNTAYPEQCAENPTNDWEIPLCGVWGATMMLLETDYFGDNRYPWEKFGANLEGENYCD